MTTQIVVWPSGPKATPEAIEAWRLAAQKIADENESEVELIGRRADGSIESFIIATPAAADREAGDG